MQPEENLKQLSQLWHQLTPAQRKIIALRTRFHLLEIAFYILIIRLFIFTARLITPVPKKIQAHFL